MAKFYLTSAIPYVNAAPHIGHALEFIQSDTIARYHKIIGDTVALLCGSDENALKNVQAAEAAGLDVQTFVNKNAQLFRELWEKLGAKFDYFEQGSNKEHHYVSSQKLWNLCDKNGDIYKKEYHGLYCVGCELFYTKEELNENGQCYEHPGKKLEEVKEVNYFFKLSKYKQQLIELIRSDLLEIVPAKRKNEALEFLNNDLKDFSISRSNERAKNWGVPVPNDDSQRIYVWFDALNIYQSGIGFGWNDSLYKKWWPADLHVIGKGILRFHAIYWPAILLSANLALPKKLFIHDYITVNGQKMSKTLGNVLDPVPLIEKYGADALRYYLLAKVSPFEDGDFSEDKLKGVYNADLANGLGNLISRVAKLCESANYQQLGSESHMSGHLLNVEIYSEALSKFRFNDALAFVWQKIARLDKFINEEKPWELVKNNNPKIKNVLAHSVDQIQEIAGLLEPFLPETAQKIEDQFQGPKIMSQKPLFPRLT